MNNLAGKVALVSGSGRGIGRSIALKLARHGAKVVVNDLDEAPGKAVADEIKALGGEAVAVMPCPARPPHRVAEPHAVSVRPRRVGVPPSSPAWELHAADRDPDHRQHRSGSRLLSSGSAPRRLPCSHAPAPSSHSMAPHSRWIGAASSSF